MRSRALVALLALLALPAVATRGDAQERVEGNSYVNERHGIRITKPPSWHFITARAVVELAKQAGGGARLRGEDDPVKLAGFAVIVSKVPMVGREVAPQVIVVIQELPQPPDDLARTCERLRSGMTEPETLAPTRLVDLGGRPAARLDFQGLVDGAMVRATALCAVRGQTAFVVVGQALAAEFQSEFSTFDGILRSFQLR